VARTSIATDNFNRASLDANWAQLNSFWGSIGITASTRVYGSVDRTPGDGAAARWVGAGTFTDDQYSSLVVGALTWLTTSYNIGVICRASADTDGTRDYYGASVCMDAAGPTYTTVLYKVVNGTITTLHSAAATWAVSDRIELEVEGTTLRVCKNGTALGGSFTQTDSSLSTGAPGVALGGGTTIYGDDWEAGTITAAATTTRGMPFGNRSTAFNGGRVFTGPIY
jgi:hypothetical protein